MAKLGKAFDSSHHDDMNDGFDPMPAGVYKAMIVDSDYLKNSKKTGHYAKFQFKIIEGEFKGRFVWTNLNLDNPNTITVEIAQKELATLCRACGKNVVQDTTVLHGIPINMKIKIKPAKGDYPAGNEPIGYTSLSKISKADKDALSASGEAPTPDPDEGGEPGWPEEE